MSKENKFSFYDRNANTLRLHQSRGVPHKLHPFNGIFEPSAYFYPNALWLRGFPLPPLPVPCPLQDREGSVELIPHRSCPPPLAALYYRRAPGSP